MWPSLKDPLDLNSSRKEEGGKWAVEMRKPEKKSIKTKKKKQKLVFERDFVERLEVFGLRGFSPHDLAL